MLLNHGAKQPAQGHPHSTSALDSNGRAKAARRRPLPNIKPVYFLGVSTGVGTLSITEDEPRMLVM
jgi:hypothetical protein